MKKTAFISTNALLVVLIVLCLLINVLSNRQFLDESAKSYGIAFDLAPDYVGRYGLDAAELERLENTNLELGEILLRNGKGAGVDFSVRSDNSDLFEDFYLELNGNGFFSEEESSNYEEVLIDDSKIEESSSENYENIEIINEFKGLFEEQKQINSDTIGWIQIPGSVINYPIMYRNDNSYYLKHNSNKSPDANGAIFLDELLDGKFSKISLIHGHNMKTSAMFGSLTSYKNQEYFDSHQSLFIFDGERTREYKAFSAFIVDPKQEVISVYFYNTLGYENYFRELQAKSMVNSELPEGVQEIIILNTCSYEYRNEGRQTRTLVCFYRVR